MDESKIDYAYFYKKEKRNIYLITDNDFINLQRLSHDLHNTRYEMISILEKYTELPNIKNIIKVLTNDYSFNLLIQRHKNIVFDRVIDTFEVDTRRDPVNMNILLNKEETCSTSLLIPFIINRDIKDYSREPSSRGAWPMYLYNDYIHYFKCI